MKWFPSLLAQIPFGYDSANDLESILSEQIKLHWIEKEAGTLHFKITEELPNSIIERMINLLKVSLKNYLPEYSIKINGHEVVLKRRSRWLNFLLFINVITRSRIEKFKINLREDIDELTLFYNINLAKMQFITQQTEKPWKINLNVQSIPYQAYYSYEDKVHSLANWGSLNFIAQVTRYQDETKIYPRLITNSVHDGKKHLNKYSYAYRNELLTVLSKMICFGISCLPTIYEEDEYQRKKLFLQSLPLLIILKFTIGYLDRKLIQWSLILEQKNSLDLQKTDIILSSISTIPLGYLVGDINSISPMILDCVANDLFLRVHPVKSYLGISNQKIAARKAVIQIIQYLFPNQDFKFTLKQIIYSRKKFLDINIDNLKLTAFQKHTLLSIIPTTLAFFGILSDQINEVLQFQFPHETLELGQSEKFTNVVISIIQETIMIARKLNKLEISKDLWKICVSFKYSQYRGSIFLDPASVKKFDQQLIDQFSIQTVDGELQLTLCDQDLSFNQGIVDEKIKFPPALIASHSTLKSDSESDSDSTIHEKKDNESESDSDNSINIENDKEKINYDTTSEEEQSTSSENDSPTISDSEQSPKISPKTHTTASISSPKPTKKIDLPKLDKKVLAKIKLVRNLIKAGGYVRTKMNGSTLEVYLNISEIEERLKAADATIEKSRNGTKLTLNFQKTRMYVMSMGEKELKSEQKLSEKEKTKQNTKIPTPELGIELKTSPSESKTPLCTEPQKYLDKERLSHLMREFGEAFSREFEIRYDFSKTSNKITPTFFEIFSYFSLCCYLVNPNLTSAICGSLAVAPLLQINPNDIDCLLYPAIEQNFEQDFDPEEFLKPLKAKKWIDAYHKESRVGHIILYNVSIGNTNIQVKFCNRAYLDGGKLNFIHKTLYLEIKWLKQPTVHLGIPAIAKDFVSAIRKSESPPFQMATEFSYTKYLKNPQIKDKIKIILQTCYPEENKKRITCTLDTLEKSSKNDGSFKEEILTATLSILNLIDDIKRLFDAHSEFKTIKFAHNSFISQLISTFGADLIHMAGLVHPAPAVGEEKRPAWTFTEKLSASLQKHFIKIVNKKAVSKEQTRHIFTLAKDVLCYEVKIKESNQKSIDYFFSSATTKIFDDPEIRQYYVSAASAIHSKSNKKELLNLLLIAATLTQTSEFFPSVNVYSNYDSGTYALVLQGTLNEKFKEKLKANAGIFHYSIDVDTLLKPMPEEMSKILLNRWKIYTLSIAPTSGYSPTLIGYVYQPPVPGIAVDSISTPKF